MMHSLHVRLIEAKVSFVTARAESSRLLGANGVSSHFLILHPARLSGNPADSFFASCCSMLPFDPPWFLGAED